MYQGYSFRCWKKAKEKILTSGLDKPFVRTVLGTSVDNGLDYQQ